jgi:multidrug resistance efflux pump
MNATSHNGKKRTTLREMTKGGGALALLIVLMMWLAGSFVEKIAPGSPAPKPQPPKVNTQKVERKVYPLVIEQVGTVRAQTEARVSSRIMAQVREIPVKEGDTVRGGNETGSDPTIMARLQDADVKARLQQAEAQLESLERALEGARSKQRAARAQVEAAQANREKTLDDYRRYEDLRRSEAATGQQVDHARAQKEVAEANLSAASQEVKVAESEIKRIEAQREQSQGAVAEARAMLGYTVIHAPFAGKIVRKLVDVGDMASPGQPLFLVETASHLELHAFVSESLIPRLSFGQEMAVQIDALDRTFSGILREIVPKSDPSTRTVQVKIALPPDPHLVSGLFGRLRVPYGTYEALVVPIKAVREVGQLMLVDALGFDGYPQRRFVTLGQAHDGVVDVLSGLQENEEVVIP